MPEVNLSDVFGSSATSFWCFRGYSQIFTSGSSALPFCQSNTQVQTRGSSFSGWCNHPPIPRITRGSTPHNQVLHPGDASLRYPIPRQITWIFQYPGRRAASPPTRRENPGSDLPAHRTPPAIPLPHQPGITLLTDTHPVNRRAVDRLLRIADITPAEVHPHPGKRPVVEDPREVLHPRLPLRLCKAGIAEIFLPAARRRGPGLSLHRREGDAVLGLTGGGE